MWKRQMCERLAAVALGVGGVLSGAGAGPPAPGAGHPASEDLGVGSAARTLILRGDCRLTMVGDSITNRNNNSNISSMYWAVLRNWRPERWVGVCVPTNHHAGVFEFTTIGGARATTVLRDLVGREPIFFTHGYSRIAQATTRDTIWDKGADTPDNWLIHNCELHAGGPWAAGDWFEGVEMRADFVVMRSPHLLPTFTLRSGRLGQGGSSVVVDGLDGDPATIKLSMPPIPAGPGGVYATLRAAPGHDESLEDDHLIWFTTRFHRPGVRGFQLDALAVGEARVGDFLEDGLYATDHFLRGYFDAVGGPTLFSIQLGANDRNFTEQREREMVELIDRLDRICESLGLTPRFLLVCPYGTRESITHAQAMEASLRLHRIAARGTARVHEKRISFLSLPVLLGGPMDPQFLHDRIHPNHAGSDMLGQLTWAAIDDPGYCAYDLTGSSNPSDPGYGVPDGALDVQDFFYFLDHYAAGSAEADMTSTGDPGDGLYGVPDGVVDVLDFFFFIDRMAEGCDR